MNVVCVGNMNNMLFGLVRYLRDKGINARLFYLGNEFSHFYPNNDTFDNDFINYCYQVKWGAINTYLRTSVKQIKKDIGKPDFIIASDDGIPFLNKAGYVIDIIFPSGTDLTLKTNVFTTMKWYAKIINPNLYFFSKSYHLGFIKALCINQENSQLYYKDILIKLGIYNKTYYFGCPMVYSKPYFLNNEFTGQEGLINLFNSIRSRNKLVIFYHNRLNWTGKDFTEEHHKGTDILIYGFSQLINIKNINDAHLILLEYGQDIEATKKLIDDLGIQDKVSFFSKLPRKDLLFLLKMSDFGCGQFYNGGLGGGTTWEVLAMGKPLLHYLNLNQISFSGFDSPFPFVNVKTPEEICDVLYDFIKTPIKYKEIGIKAREWYIRNFEEGCVNRWIELIEVKQTYGSSGLAKFVKDRVKYLNEI
jgi:glycosyltransferase involved in cell wall biosynthesis